MPRLLVIDDEAAIRHAFDRAFASEETEVVVAETAAEGERLFAQISPDVVVLDLRLPDKSGLDCFRRLREIDARIPVIFITGHGTVEAAIEATKLGAYDYLFKPLELVELQTLVAKAFNLSRMIRVQPVLPGVDQPDTGETIVGRCKAMKDVYTTIGRVAPQDITVLLLGESGSGKELIAQAIYHHSSRASGPFQAINCAAIPDTLLESEIFGHERGAFTGADRVRIGKLEQANGGTLFLDEVGDMSPLTQAKLLRVLQNQTFERVGGNELIRVDVRLIAATNHDLNQLVAEGLFRSDLYFRLNGMHIQLPPLRDRDEDLGLLAEHFLRRYSTAFGKEVRSVAPETLERLRAYHWPGNVRELENVIKQSLLQARGTVLLPQFLPDLTAGRAMPLSDQGPQQFLTQQFVAERIAADSHDLHGEAIALVERQLFEQVLAHTHGNQLQAASILGISRVTLRSKIRILEIDVSQFTS
ncbi:sigma-54-dependent transcriptional regulator [Lignipirellula cremea]|uniref:DNA-binding transcriptional regulator NtrC n=1 Tax=Lignipirellula cremea TaxID=2528010 RepID=A0A518DX47_9BACT|nr:sigma-54 dependent transcriptional regulator [Lignipirellula cremea]QDU96395.1 Nitrogen assimilation regulatory protein [Lignipirellula cremea]